MSLGPGDKLRFTGATSSRTSDSGRPSLLAKDWRGLKHWRLYYRILKFEPTVHLLYYLDFLRQL